MEASRRNVPRDRPVLDTSYQPSHNDAESLSVTKTSCDYKDDMIVAIAPLAVILLAFGGRWSVLVACVGGTICYIFDLLGSVEGTIGTLILTVLGEVACLVFAARVFLLESLLNFSVIVLMWIALFFCFLISCNYFVGIVREMSMVLVVMNQLIFATLPMVAASIISWFLCIEMPSLDLLLCFNVTYFAYMLHAGRPRLATSDVKKTGKGSPVAASTPMQVILPPHLLLLMYSIPIVVTILMHIAIHHNVLSTTHTRITNFLLSVLVPCLLMSFCAHRQIIQQNVHFHSDDAALVENLPKFLDVSTLVLSTAMVYCVESHPIMDELKSFSELSEELAGYAIMAMVGCIVAAFSVHRFCREQSIILAEHTDGLSGAGGSTYAESKLKLKFMSMVASLLIGLANALFALLIGLPDHAVGVSIVGAMALAEYYLHPDWSITSRILLVCIAALYSSLAGSSFIRMTLHGISFEFNWHFDMSFPDFTLLINCLIPVAICLPTIVGHEHASALSNAALGLLPGARAGNHGMGPLGVGASMGEEEGGMFGSRPIGNVVFEWIFPVVCAVITGVELMIREQDWSEILVGVDVVYPMYYFISMTALVAGTSAVLYKAQVIGPVCLWILMVMQSCKLLHLLGIPSAGAVTTCLMILAYSLPFIRTITKYLHLEQQTESATAGSHSTYHLQHQRHDSHSPRSPVHAASKANIGALELFAYIGIATVATYWARMHMIPHNILQVLLSRDPTELQQTSLCMAVWLGYVGCVLAVFYRSSKVIRSVVLVMCGLFLLIALEGFGHLNLTIEKSSSDYLTIAFHPDMNVQEHPALFFFLTSALSGLAWIGLIPLTSIPVCLLYSALFGFISSKAMLGWAFPLSMADDSLSHSIVAFPFVYLFAAKFMLTFVAVWNPQLISSKGHGNTTVVTFFTEAPLVLACAMPFFGMLWALSANVYVQAQSGISWSAAVGFATLCLTTRARELFHEAAAVTKTSRFNIPKASINQPFSACVPCALFTIFWVSFAVLSSHGYDKDLFIPLSSLTLLCTAPGVILQGKAPLVVVGVFCAVFWTASSFYSCLIKGYGSDASLVMFEKPQDYFGLDSDVSIWTATYMTVVWINLGLVLFPLPAVMSGLMPQFGRSEDVVFVFALLSLVPVFSAHISSLRYLGLCGLVFSAAKGYQLSDRQQRSDRLI